MPRELPRIWVSVGVNINRDREIPSRFLQFIIEELAAKIYQQMWYFLL
ncbi:hypothetical protein HPL003_21265 [Paenibacillus terrae HPL-003]|uniref:Uncharacterized protein n=1 Tax=Paenibacillus terrae (strain HPL-003) TaxID=985665 RepID=G7VPB0_PAETH|nr:hypothetical protein HPL003_21265 [Paenibacillus terrae HPL-003]